MSKREIRKKDYQNIENELSYFEKQEMISSLQKNNMLNHYTIKQKLNPMRLLLIIGLILLFLGVTAFVAGSLLVIEDNVKLILLVLWIIFLHFLGVKNESNYPVTSRIAHYSAISGFGAGLILLQEMFLIFSNDYTTFLVYGIGILPYVYILKDKNILIFSGILLFIYNLTSYSDIDFPYAVAVIIPVLYLLNAKIEGSNSSLYFSNILSIQFIAIVLERLFGFDTSEGSLISALILLIIGIGMVFIPFKKEIKPVFERVGYLLHGSIGLALSFPVFWEYAGFGAYTHILFILIYAIIIVKLIKKGSLFALFIGLLLVLRVYFTLVLGVIPDAIAYILSGFVFMTLGLYFEKKRKSGGKKIE